LDVCQLGQHPASITQQGIVLAVHRPVGQLQSYGRNSALCVWRKIPPGLTDRGSQKWAGIRLNLFRPIRSVLEYETLGEVPHGVLEKVSQRRCPGASVADHAYSRASNSQETPVLLITHIASNSQETPVLLITQNRTAIKKAGVAVHTARNCNKESPVLASTQTEHPSRDPSVAFHIGNNNNQERPVMPSTQKTTAVNDPPFSVHAEMDSNQESPVLLFM
jgi:hypothetical protein